MLQRICHELTYGISTYIHINIYIWVTESDVWPQTTAMSRTHMSRTHIWYTNVHAYTHIYMHIHYTNSSVFGFKLLRHGRTKRGKMKNSFRKKRCYIKPNMSRTHIWRHLTLNVSRISTYIHINIYIYKYIYMYIYIYVSRSQMFGLKLPPCYNEYVTNSHIIYQRIYI